MGLKEKIREDVRSLKSYVPGKRIYSSKRNVKLSSNENRLGPSLKAIEAIGKINPMEYSIYPESAYKAIKTSLKEFWSRHGCQIQENQMVLGNGSGEVLNMILAAFINQNDRVLISEQSFSLYSLLSIPKGGQVIEIPRINFHVNLKEMIKSSKSLKNLKLIILANPDNPTSTFIPKSELIDMMRLIPDDIPVLIDEAYIHFAGIENSMIDQIESFPNLIVTHTFSKCYGLASLRLGYAIMHEEIALEIEKLRLPFNLSINQLFGGMAALEDEEFLTKTINLVNIERKFLEKNFKTLGFDCVPSFANFIFVKLGQISSELNQYLESQGITIRLLQSFGFSSEYARITIGTHEDNEYLIQSIKNFIEKNYE